MVNKDELLNFKHLNNSRLIVALLNQIKNTEEQLWLHVGEIQERCLHTAEIKETREKKDRFYSENNSLISKNCADCGFEFEKPKGMPWVVCDNCWGSMQESWIEPIEGGRRHHYRCTKCGHHESYT